MRMPVGLKVGDLAEIVFLDHVEDGIDPIEFEVIGRVSNITKRAVTVRCWNYRLAVDAATHNDHNVKSFTIVKKAMSSISILKPSR